MEFFCFDSLKEARGAAERLARDMGLRHYETLSEWRGKSGRIYLRSWGDESGEGFNIVIQDKWDAEG